MNELYLALKQFGHVKTNEPMSKHTTFKIGGPVDALVTVIDTDQAVKLFQYLDGEGVPYFLVGGGSNMLVRDEGFRGVAVRMNNQQLMIDGQTVVAHAGCVTVDVAQKTMAAGLTGFEWGVGVPGTIGGAVRGNAGAAGVEMKDNVFSVDVYRDGDVVTLANADCRFGYRDSVFKHDPGVVLRATLSLTLGDTKVAFKQAMDNLQYRNKTQPQGYASIGCTFKNVDYKAHVSALEQSKQALPPEFVAKGKIPAGWLVEQVGMKGVTVGKAQVSERHANFIVNLGGAMAADVLTLIEQIKTRVYDTYGVLLEEEIQII